MSANKFKFYEVNQTTVVKAANKADAMSIARGRRGVNGQLLGATSTVDRITASEAHGWATESVS